MTDTALPQDEIKATAAVKADGDNESNDRPISPKKPAVVDEASESPDDDEEENFLQNIEKKEAAIKEEEGQDYHQPQNTSAAPRLLQDALKKGDVKADESEEEKKDEGATSAEKEAGNANEVEEQEQVHQRVSERVYPFDCIRGSTRCICFPFIFFSMMLFFRDFVPC